ncbi:quinone oxidoreductase family protein [Sediminivirga luteola]|uniref:Quinone oxidoreductase n=1 Tax=Sediminivirga luteola TaxID=1774748 RepID=A0A8J2U0G8_9MICO|nr:quinone oxidoreductase [Sediminivirga luteola]MCI2265317.1 quinone oxidoreductase [Sediminivirga luteola]GGA24891.1 quinone oxidoreductase [Sediminivirga luteola]
MAHAIVAVEAGGPEVLGFHEIEDPVPQHGELLVRTGGIGVNFIDTYRRSGVYPEQFPHIPGREGAGTVVALGPGVEGFEVGDRVAWHEALHSYATLVRVPVAHALHVPEDVDDVTAAAIPLQGLTAQYLATDSHQVQAGQTALVHAAAGGVGLLLTQILKHLGARVIGTVGTEEKAELARQAGADEVFLYGEGVDIAATVASLTDGKGADVVYDGVGKDTFDASLASTAVRGSLVLYGGASGQVPPFDIQRLNSAGGVFLSRPSLVWFTRTREELEERAAFIFAGLREGWLSFRVGATYPLAQAEQAHRDLQGRKTTGKVVLVP